MPKEKENEIEKYLKSKKIEYKETGNGQYCLRECPSCGDRKGTHFYIDSETGLCLCHKCEFKGNYNQLRALFGDDGIDLSDFAERNPKSNFKKTFIVPEEGVDKTYVKNLSKDKDTIKYLTKERGLSLDTIKKFNIGVRSDGKISIPIYKDGKLVNIRYRRSPKDKLDGAKYITEKNCKAEIFNGDFLEKENPKKVIITEGEFDAMTLIQNGFPAVSITLGANNFPDDWIQRFAGVENIYICYDHDIDGQAGAKLAASKLGVDRCKNVLLPSVDGRKKTDVTDFFTTDKKTKKDFSDILKNSKAISEELVLHIRDISPALRELILSGDTYGIGTGYEMLDDLVGGLRKGRLIVISGLTSVGKSSFADCIALNIANRDIPVLMFSLEMPPVDTVKKFLILHTKLSGKELREVKDPSDKLKTIDKALIYFSAEGKNGNGVPIYFYNKSGMLKLAEVETGIKIAQTKYDCKVVVVDHLQYFNINPNNVTADTAFIVRQLKDIAVRYNIPIVLLAHLNRGGRATQRKGLYTPALSDLRDSGSIEQDADQVLFVCRDSENDDLKERQKAFIKIAKNRDGQAGRTVSMEFTEDIGSFAEATGADYAKEAETKKADLKKEVDVAGIDY